MKRKAREIMILTVIAVSGIVLLSIAGCGGGYYHMMGPYGRGPGWHNGDGYSSNISNNADYYGSNYGNSRYRGYGSMTENGPGSNDYCLP